MASARNTTYAYTVQEYHIFLKFEIKCVVCDKH